LNYKSGVTPLILYQKFDLFVWWRIKVGWAEAKDLWEDGIT